MQSALLNTAMAALALSASIHASEVSAKVKDMKFHFVTGAHEDYPVYEFKFKDGKWKWVNKGKTFRPRMKVYSKHNNKHTTSANFLLEGSPIGKISKLPKKYEKLVTLDIGSNILQKKASAAAGACKAYGGSKKLVKDMGLVGQFDIISGQMNGGGRRTAVMTTKVVCHAKPSGGQQAGGTHTAKPVLTQLKLYPVPAVPQCGKPVKMVAEFHTTIPGKVNFLYHRDDGAKQKATVVTTTKMGNGYFNRWSKTYTFDETTTRKYAILVKDQNKSTQWVPLNVKCFATNGEKSG